MGISTGFPALVMLNGYRVFMAATTANEAVSDQPAQTLGGPAEHRAWQRSLTLSVTEARMSATPVVPAKSALPRRT